MCLLIIRWPLEFVLSDQNKDRVTYNQLSPVQWMAGFCRTIREESDIIIREYMLDYVIDLLDDATDFSWAWQRPAMLSFCAGWNRGRLRAGQRQKKSTGCAGPMLKDTTLVKVVHREQKTNIRLQKLPPVCIIKGFLPRNKHMRQKGFYTNMCVLHVGPKMARHILTL